MDLELRIAPELYLKELIIGGFEKVFEIGKVFRNEGIDTSHNPEFTTIEFYQAYAGWNDMMEFTKRLLKRLAVTLYGSLKIAIPKQEIRSSHDESHITNHILEIDFDAEFPKYDVMTEIQEYIGEKIDLKDPDLRLKLEGILYNSFAKKYHDGMSEKQLIDKLIEGIIEPKCVQPSYIVNHPYFMSPLAKRCEDNPLLSQRFELFIDNVEIGNVSIITLISIVKLFTTHSSF